jgi:hypothetical protein
MYVPNERLSCGPYFRLMEAPLLLATGPVINPEPINRLICR